MTTPKILVAIELDAWQKPVAVTRIATEAAATASVRFGDRRRKARPCRLALDGSRLDGDALRAR